HDAVDDNRRRLQRARRALNREHPFRREAVDVLLVDLVERAESIAAQISMIGRPLAGLRPRDVGERYRLIVCARAGASATTSAVMTTSVESRIASKFILSASMRHSATVPALPPTSHAAPVDSFARAFELERELTGTVRGEVRFDRGRRALYATDGSNYRQIPIGLVIPRDADA